MTVTLHWWYLPVAFLVAAMLIPTLWPNQLAFNGPEGWSYLKLLTWAGCIALAIGITVGHFI